MATEIGPATEIGNAMRRNVSCVGSKVRYGGRKVRQTLTNKGENRYNIKEFLPKK